LGGPKNHAFDGGSDPPEERAFCGRRWAPSCNGAFRHNSLTARFTRCSVAGIRRKSRECDDRKSAAAGVQWRYAAA